MLTAITNTDSANKMIAGVSGTCSGRCEDR